MIIPMPKIPLFTRIPTSTNSFLTETSPSSVFPRLLLHEWDFLPREAVESTGVSLALLFHWRSCDLHFRHRHPTSHPRYFPSRNQDASLPSDLSRIVRGSLRRSGWRREGRTFDEVTWGMVLK